MAIKKIEINKLDVGMFLADPVYVEMKNKRILLMSGGKLITDKMQIKRMFDAGIKSVEIDTDKGTNTFLSLIDQKKWGEIALQAKDKGATEAIIKRHLNTVVNSITLTILKNFTSRILVGEDPISSLFKDIVFKVENNIDLLFAMIRLRSVSEYTFSHSTNTMVLCISVANFLNFRYSDILRFGVGTLLADIGMTNYPSRMVLRPSGLSKREIEEIQKHPMYAVEFLKKNGINDPFIETVILQHHERFDGTGYPYKLKGDEIHPISKLFAIADVYDAMTSFRPHRKGYPPHMALAEILKMSGSLFDIKMAKTFIKFMGVFPVGNMVELTNGRLAIVAGRNMKDPLRPLVIIFNTKKKLRSSKKADPNDPGIIITRGQWELIDLSDDNGYYGQIKRGLDHRKFRINPAFYLNQV